MTEKVSARQVQTKAGSSHQASPAGDSPEELRTQKTAAITRKRSWEECLHKGAQEDIYHPRIATSTLLILTRGKEKQPSHPEKTTGKIIKISKHLSAVI